MMYYILHGDLPPYGSFIWWIYGCELFNNLYWLNCFGQRLKVKYTRGWYDKANLFFLIPLLLPILSLCVCACAWRQPNKSLYLLPWLVFLITAFFTFIQPSIFPAEDTHACTHKKKSPQCTLICLLLHIERHLLINLQSATVDPPTHVLCKNPQLWNLSRAGQFGSAFSCSSRTIPSTLSALLTGKKVIGCRLQLCTTPGLRKGQEWLPPTRHS